MVEQALSSLDKYDLEIKGVRKGRGFWIVNCKNGDYVLKEYRGSQERVLLQKTLTTQIMEETGVIVQEIVPNKEGELISIDGDERKYMLQTYMEGRECNLKEDGSPSSFLFSVASPRCQARFSLHRAVWPLLFRRAARSGRIPGRSRNRCPPRA